MNQQQAQQKKPVIGLLGLPGSGKSYVARVFADLGAAIVDADQLAHEVLDEPQALDQLRQWWGDQVVDQSGDEGIRADRAVIGRVVFKDSDQLERLENFVHPRVGARRENCHRQYQADESIVAIIEDSPLLIEKGLDSQCDALVLVEAPRPVRLGRLNQTRGWDEAELDRREKWQTPLDIKRQRADHVVTNDGQHDVHAQVRRTLNNIQQRV